MDWFASPQHVAWAFRVGDDGIGPVGLHTNLFASMAKAEPTYAPTTPAQRAAFVDAAVRQLSAWLLESPRLDESRLPSTLPAEVRQRASTCLREIAGHEYAHRLALREAIHAGLLAADPPDAPRANGSRGQEGQLSVDVDDPDLWGGPRGKATLRYFVDFARYPRVGAAADALAAAEAALADLLRPYR